VTGLIGFSCIKVNYFRVTSEFVLRLKLRVRRRRDYSAQTKRQNLINGRSQPHSNWTALSHLQRSREEQLQCGPKN